MLIARVPSLPGCHTYTHDWDELPARLREAGELCLADDEDAPSGTCEGDQQLVGAFQLEVASWGGWGSYPLARWFGFSSAWVSWSPDSAGRTSG